MHFNPNFPSNQIVRKASNNSAKVVGGIPPLKILALNELKKSRTSAEFISLINEPKNAVAYMQGSTKDVIFDEDLMALCDMNVCPVLSGVASKLYFRGEIIFINEYKLEIMGAEHYLFTGYAKKNHEHLDVLLPVNAFNNDIRLEFKNNDLQKEIYIKNMECFYDEINKKSYYMPTGQVKEVCFISDGTKVKQEGTWGRRDPNNPKSWGMTGQGKIIEYRPDGTKHVENEGTWGRPDPNNPNRWWITGQGNNSSKKRHSSPNDNDNKRHKVNDPDA